MNARDEARACEGRLAVTMGMIFDALSRAEEALDQARDYAGESVGVVPDGHPLSDLIHRLEQRVIATGDDVNTERMMAYDARRYLTRRFEARLRAQAAKEANQGGQKR